MHDHLSRLNANVNPRIASILEEALAGKEMSVEDATLLLDALVGGFVLGAFDLISEQAVYIRTMNRLPAYQPFTGASWMRVGSC